MVRSAVNQPLQVFLVDDHRIVTDGLSRLIDAESDLNVCGTASNTTAAREGIDQHQPDIVVLDLALGRESGLELLPELLHLAPRIKVLMLSMYDEQVYAERALKAGALGFIMKEEAAERILDAIRQVSKGKVFLSPSMTSRILQRSTKQTSDSPVGSPERLSDRELETFRLIGLGRSSREIAEQLHLSIKTVDNYKERIKRKLNLRNANELARYACDFAANRTTHS
jgi:DNA-binding NarL/FixJ family response regulator